jgi:hypothetical protein
MQTPKIVFALSAISLVMSLTDGADAASSELRWGIRRTGQSRLTVRFRFPYSCGVIGRVLFRHECHRPIRNTEIGVRFSLSRAPVIASRTISMSRFIGSSGSAGCLWV